MQNYIVYIKYTTFTIGILIAFGLGLAWPLANDQTIQSWPWFMGALCVIGWILLEKVVAPLLLSIWRALKFVLKPAVTTLIIVIAGLANPVKRLSRFFAMSKQSLR